MNFEQLCTEKCIDCTISTQVIAGARGTYLTFKLKSQLEVATSDYLFNQLGNDETSNFDGDSPNATNVRSILTSIKITGLTTGSSLEIPLLLIKKIS